MKSEYKYREFLKFLKSINLIFYIIISRRYMKNDCKDNFLFPEAKSIFSIAKRGFVSNAWRHSKKKAQVSRTSVGRVIE